MALKSYKSVTLNGNWFEERGRPLRGVIAENQKNKLRKDYFKTTSEDAFKPPRTKRAAPQRRGMISSKQFLFGGKSKGTYTPKNFGMGRSFPETHE